MKSRTTSNQWSLGVGYHRSTIYGSNKHMVWISYGYNTVCWAWNKNPKAPHNPAPPA